jgi:hypothetical protein
MREELRKLESGKQAIESFAMKEKVSKLQVDRLRTLLGSGEINEACPPSPHATMSKTKAATGPKERNMPIPWCRFARWASFVTQSAASCMKAARRRVSVSPEDFRKGVCNCGPVCPGTLCART